ncbi:MAG: PQQ-binding-like beta-propeller repeat protein [Pirellulales bacterium]|nr:PQQ-binding-like beta-propeller repeat protein [Pirellulales bacterium]
MRKGLFPPPRFGWRPISALALTLAFAAAHARAADWPQFRGPDGQGRAMDGDPPLRWDEGQNIAWKAAVRGQGWSSPVIGGGQVWLTTADEGGHSLRAVCLDLASGELLHDVEVFRIAELPGKNEKNSYASPTPVLEQGKLYVHYGTLGTACLDAQRGEVLWRNQEIQVDHKEGPGSSPLLHGELLIVPFDGMDQQLVAAFDKRTGRIAWRAPRSGARNPNPDFRKAYSTPLIVAHHGREELLSVGADRVSAYDPATGRELWYVTFEGFSNVPRPVWERDRVYVCTGYMKPQLLAVELGSEGDVTRSHVAWRYERNVPANPSPLILDGLLYFVSDTGVATCLEAESGKLVWTKRWSGNFSASPVAAAGRIYWFNEEGEARVIAAGRTYRELAHNRLRGRVLASPAVVGRALVVRTDGHVYRLEEGGR